MTVTSLILIIIKWKDLIGFIIIIWLTVKFGCLCGTQNTFISKRFINTVFLVMMIKPIVKSVTLVSEL